MGLVIDLFAGGGGASLGLRWALGRDPDIAINHDTQAVAMHQANHPGTLHLVNDVWTVPPLYATQGQPVDLLWASPDCKHFSKAKGGRPREQGVRDLAWVVVEWAKTARPNLIFLENVEEFKTWGPLDAAGNPVRALAGTTFAAWVRKLRRAGYRVEWRELRACDFGAPTIRKRLFLIARRDGLPIIWPEPTHGPGRPEPHRTAAECIDWGLPCPSIFGRKRPLAKNTLRRIAAGIKRFVLDAAEPFIITALSPVLAGVGDTALTSAFLAENHQALCAAFLAKHYGGVVGSPLTQPIGTITGADHHSLVTSHLCKLRGTCKDGQDLRQPAPTCTAGGTHAAEVRTLLIKYYGQGMGQTLTVHGQPYALADVGLRMLQPRELFRAQGFPDTYVIGDDPAQGLSLTKAAQVRLCGNSVCPPIAAALVRANAVQVAREVA